MIMEREEIPQILPEDQKTEDQKMQWYVIKAYSGFEKYVMKALQERIKDDPLFGEVFVPTETVVEMRRGQKCTSERKCFPGYVLVQMVMTDDTWHTVKAIPKVQGFVGGTKEHPERPVPISEKDVFQMRAGVDKPKPKTVYEVGEVVRIIDGPFTDFNGVVEEVNYDKNRLRVAVLIFGRSTPVELEFGQVTKG